MNASSKTRRRSREFKIREWGNFRLYSLPKVGGTSVTKHVLGRDRGGKSFPALQISVTITALWVMAKAGASSVDPGAE